jgi:hypothetical protein
LRYRGLAALSVLALLLSGCGSIGGRFVAYDSVAGHIRSAATALQHTAGVRVYGTVRDATAKTLSIDVQLNGGGDGIGRVTRNGVVGNVVIVDGSTYVRATAAWWAPDTRAESYDRTWVKAAATTVGLDFATTLRPKQLGTTVEQTFVDAAASEPPLTMVNGVAARKITTDEGSLWLSAAAPYRVVRLEGTMLTQPVALMVSTMTPLATAQTSREVALLLSQLRAGTYDAQHALQFDGTLASSCDATGCTVTGRIRNVSTDAPVTAVLNGKVIGQKVVLGRCQSARTPIAAASATTVSCRVATTAWRAFYASATAPDAIMATTSYQASADTSAIGPAPDAASCLPGGTGCATPTTTTAQVFATFDRSAKAWYKKPVTDANLPGWRALIRAAAAGKDRVPWSSQGAPTVAYLGASKGVPFVAQFSRGNGALVSAYGPDDDETAALRQAVAGRP